MSTTVLIPPIRPNAIPEDRFAQNGDVPSVAALRRSAWALNHASVHQRKVLFCRSYDTQGTHEPSSAIETTIYFCFRTGENVEEVKMFFGLAPAWQVSATSQAFCRVDLYDGTTTLTGDPVYYPKVQSGAFQPSEVAWSKASITLADGLLANTIYVGSVTQYRYSRIHSLVVHERAKRTALSSVAGVADPKNWEVNKPITDAACQNLAETGTLLHNHNGAQLLSIGRDDSTSSLTVNSTTYTNVHSSDTAWSASAPGYVINTEFHDTAKANVQVELAARIRRTAGSGDLNIRFVQNGSTLMTKTFSGTSTTPCASTTGSFDAFSSEKTDILASCSDGSTTYEIDALGLWEYEA